MPTGLAHSHKYLAYLVLASALLGLILALAGAATKPGLGAVLARIHRFGLLLAGRFVFVFGLGITMMGGHSMLQGWLIAGILGWAVVEIAAKRMVKPALNDEGGNLLAGTALQFISVLVVFGLMQMKPF
jgi:hypothetical protein